MTRLADLGEELLRAVHPQYLDAGKVTYRAFVPTKADAGNLSVAQGSKTTAEQVVAGRVAAGRKCAGVAVVTVGEVERVGLTAFEDPIADNTAHAIIAFGAGSPDAAAFALADGAEARGLR